MKCSDEDEYQIGRSSKGPTHKYLGEKSSENDN
jgi:hypothetical protein